MKKRKKPTALARVTSKELVQQFDRVREHPIGSLLLDDLVATSQFGSKNARVGIAADGNPVVVGHDATRVNALAECIANQTRVHRQVVPPIEDQDFRVMMKLAAKNMSGELPPGAKVLERTHRYEGEGTLADHTHEADELDESGHRPSCDEHPRHHKSAGRG
jgi:hypothetical protein